MNIIKFKLKELMFFIFLSLSILPIINIRGFDVPVLFLFIPFGFFVLLLVLLGRIKIPKINKIIILFFLMITLEIFLSTFIGTLTAFNRLIFPNDVIQYIARLLCFLTFSIIFYYGKIDVRTFIRFFLIILIVAMTIGVFQWLSWPGQQFFINLYPFRDGSLQLSQLDRALHSLRVHGFAQHATANGGIAMFAFVFAYSVLTYYKKYRGLSIFLIVLTIINVLASQARAGLAALVFSMILLYIVRVYINRKSFKPTIKLLFTLFLTSIVGYFLYIRDNPFVTQLVYRWEALFETSGGGRTDQIEYGFSLMTTPYDYLFGISRAYQSHSRIPFHLEVEPINIMVLYGFSGFLLQYFLILFILWYLFKNLRGALNNPKITAIVVASFVSLASYQVFSLGYFFFREIRIGLIPWILIGVTIGVVEKYKMLKNDDIKKEP